MKMHTKFKNVRGAFTLVELLTVIAVIALMATLVFSVWIKMQNKNLDVMAINNLRQVGAALFAHAAEHDGYFPTARGTLGYTADSSNPELLPWQQQLDPYIGYSGTSTDLEDTREIFHLPAKVGYQRRGESAFFLGSYASLANARSANEVPNGSDGFQPVLQTRITRPDLHILAGEQGAMMFEEIDADKDDYNQDPAFGGGKLHRDIQILFADGHVKGYDEFDPGSMTVRYEGTKANGQGYMYGEELEAN